MNKIILKAENLHYSYTKEHEVLKGVSLNIYEGERLAVLGANGSGKSTFFLNINGVLKPEIGNVYYRDNLINKASIKELRKNVGIVFQDADNQIIASTVRAEVSFGPMNLGLSKEEVKKRVETSLNYMNISHLIDRPPHYLSGGEKKRLSIADIIAMDSDPITVLGDKEILEKANLKKPILLEVFEALVENSVFAADSKPARNIDDFKKMFISQA